MKKILFLSLFIFLGALTSEKALAKGNYSYVPSNNSYPNNYYSSQPIGVLSYKWKAFPVTIYMGNVPIEYKDTVTNAINYWKTYFPLEVSNNPNSDVNIIWVDGFSSPTILGTTQHMMNNNIHKCVVRVKNKKFIKTELNEIILHELGHVVGLGESPYPEDIMYSKAKAKKGKIDQWTITNIGYIPLIIPSGYQNEVSGKSVITQRDLNTLAKIYAKSPNENIYEVNNYTTKPNSIQEQYNNQIQPNPNYSEPSVYPEDFACKCIANGNMFYKAHNYDQAIECYKKVLLINPNNPTANENMGLCYNDLKKFDLAIDCLNKSIAINPNNANTYNNLGLSYKGKGLYNKAIEYYKKSVSVNPNFDFGYSNLASIYIDTGKYDLAIENCEKAININPHFESAYINLGVAYGNKGLYKKAVESFKKALSINPNSTVAKNNYNNMIKLANTSR